MSPNSPRQPPPRRNTDSPTVNAYHATVVGLNGVGRQIALQLAALGVSRLQLIDRRTVSRSRQVAEGYDAEDVSRLRVHATAQACHEINPLLEIHTRSSRSYRRLDLGDVVLCNLDDEQACRYLRQSEWRTPGFFVLSHVFGSLIEVSTMCDACAVRDLFDLFTSRKSASPKRQNIAMPMHVASITAGLAVDQFVKSLKGFDRPQTLLLDLATRLLKVQPRR